jgi:pimeloyl-ACP methyl ester carboxylesterase
MSRLETAAPLAVRAGAGRPVVVLNGGQAFMRRADPTRTERDLGRILPLLPDGRPVHLLGYDLSPAAGHRLDDVVEAAARTIETHAGAADVVGISFGGMVGLRLAARRPDLVSRLALLVSAHRMSDEGASRTRRQIAHAEAGDFKGLVSDFAGVFQNPLLNALVAFKVWTDRKRMAEVMSPPDVIVRHLSAMLAAQDDGAWLADVTAPTLLLGGGRDPFFGPDVLRDTAAKLPNGRLILHPEAGHMLPVEQRRDTAAALADFLAG